MVGITCRTLGQLIERLTKQLQETDMLDVTSIIVRLSWAERGTSAKTF